MTHKKHLFPLILALFFQITVVEATLKGSDAPPMADLVEDPFAEFGASADPSPRAEIFRAIMAHKNKNLEQMLRQSALAETITDRKFVRAMVKRAARFNNPQAIDLLLKAYEHHVKNTKDHNYHGFVSAQLEAAGAAGVEYGFYNRKDFLEKLIHDHPQDKAIILAYALEGSAEGGHTDLVDWILTTQLSVLKARKGLLSFACDYAMSLAIENYHPEIVTKIAKLKSQGVQINPHFSFEYAYLLRDKESFLFLKKNFPVAYKKFEAEKKADKV
jgi:hypothetical protein